MQKPHDQPFIPMKTFLIHVLKCGGSTPDSRSSAFSPSAFRLRYLTLAVLAVLAVSVAHAQFTGNYQTNTYDGLTQSTGWWINPSVPALGFADYVVGSNTHHDVLQVLNGAGLTNAIGYIGHTSAASNNLAVVSSSGLWTNTGTLYVGNSGFGNQLTIMGGGQVVNASGYIGFNSGSSNNMVTVSGSGSIWNNSTSLTVGYSGLGNQLIITSGGQVGGSGTSYLGSQVTSSSNMVTVSGSSSIWNNSGNIRVGNLGFGNQLTITDGGQVVNASGYIGFNSGSSNNTATVSGSGSIWTNTVTLVVGNSSSGNQLIITNGGSVFASSVTVGSGASTTGNAVWIGSGGLLDANGVVVTNSGNSITNFGGIFQFSSATPTIMTNNGGAGGPIVLTNGTIAFRNIATANVKGNWSSLQLTNITFQGDNTFRLNAASNTTSVQDYTFNTGLGATNYVGLEMINGATAWRGGNLMIGDGGTMLVSNTTASVVGLFSNRGTVRVVNSMVTWWSNAVISGSYVSSNSSRNIFATNLTVTASGSLSGSGSNDLFVFYRDLINQSTNRAEFNLVSAAVLFTNASGATTNHTIDLSGSSAMDKGAGWLNVAQLATNFSIRTLSIAPSNRLTLMGTNFSSGLTNALYVGWLDIQGVTNGTPYAALTNSLFAALNLSSINLYYEADNPNNAYLNNQTYDLGWGQGLVIPIPEPSTVGLILGGTLFSSWLLRRRKE